MKMIIITIVITTITIDIDDGDGVGDDDDDDYYYYFSLSVIIFKVAFFSVSFLILKLKRVQRKHQRSRTVVFVRQLLKPNYNKLHPECLELHHHLTCR